MSAPIRVAVTLMQSWHRVPGGSATAALSLVEALARRDDVEMVGIGSSRSVPRPEFTPPVPCRTTRLPYQVLYELWNYTPFASPRRLVPDADVVHATTPMVPSPGGAKLVVTLHDLFPMRTPEQFTSRGVRLMTRGVAKARRLADLVVVSSEDTRRDCLDAGFPADRLRTVPLATDHTPATPEERSEARRRHALERPFVLWVGTVEPRKNLPLLIDAWGAVGGRRDVELVLVGPSGWDPELVAKLDTPGGGVRRLGFVSSRDLRALYAEAELFAFPSLREGFGLPALEAMAQGTPVLFGEDTAVAEVVGDTGVGLPVRGPGAVEAWASALGDLLDDSTRRASLGARARKRSLTFDWDRCAEAYARVYREVIP